MKTAALKILKQNLRLIATILGGVFVILSSFSVLWAKKAVTVFDKTHERRLADDVITSFISEDISGIKPLLTDKFTPDALREVTSFIRLVRQGTDPILTKTVGYWRTTDVKSGDIETNLSIIVKFKNEAAMLVQMSFARSGEKWTLVGAHFDDGRALLKKSEFQFTHLGLGHIVAGLLFLIAGPIQLLALAKWYFCAPDKKWLWFFGIILGYPAVVFDWATTDFLLEWVSLAAVVPINQILKSGHAFLQFALPSGAILFLLFGKRRPRRSYS